MLQLEAGALARFAGASEEVDRLGFDLEPFGEDAVAVRAIPALLEGRDPAALVRELADELPRAGGGAAGGLGPRALDAADRIFASLACHAARRKGEVLAPAEQRALLQALDAIPWAPTCPHGRPVAVPIEQSEIERRFGRR
jgi:DNA mismatch repair protein MutL